LRFYAALKGGSSTALPICDFLSPTFLSAPALIPREIHQLLQQRPQNLNTEENWKQKKTGLVGPAFPRREGCGYIRPDATGASSPAGQPNNWWCFGERWVHFGHQAPDITRDFADCAEMIDYQSG
jgi:hypothetical protein